MILYITRILKVFFLFMVVDGIWLLTMGQRFYRHYLGYLFADSIQYSWAILFYMIYAIALNHFVVFSSIRELNVSGTNIFIEGFFFGLVVYSAYDLTNQATIKNWPLIVTVVDMLWGSFLTGTVAILAYKFIK